MKNQNKAYLFALIAILFWSTIASAFKLTLRYLDFVDVLLYSSFISTSILWLLILIQKKTILLYRITWKDALHASIRGFLNPFLYYLVLLKAYTLLKAQEAGTLNYIWPITLVLLSIPLLKQKIGIISILAVVISFSGIMVISTEGDIGSLSFREPLGVFLALISSVFWAMYWILNIKDTKDELLKLFLNFGFGTLFIFIYAVLFEGISLPGIEGLTGSVYIGLFEMSLTYFFWLQGLKLSENSAKVSNLVYLSPFISLIIIQQVLDESIMASTVIGLALIIAGIVIQYFASPRQQSRSG